MTTATIPDNNPPSSESEPERLEGRGRSSSWTGPAGRVIVAVAIAAGLVLRIWVMGHRAGSLDSDEAVVGLMARHLLHGQFSVFFWGQPYGGSLEAIFTAGLFAVLGPSTLVLKLVPLGLDAAATVVVWRVARRTIGEPLAGPAAALFWIWPAAFVWSSVKAQAFYGAALLAAVVILLLVLRLSEGGAVRDWVLLGLVIGLGWWSTPEIAFVAVPAAAWLAFKARPRIRQVALAAVSGVAGASPWLVWNLHHHLESLRPAAQATPVNSYWDHLAGFFHLGLPEALGLRLPLSARWLGSPFAGKAAYLLVLCVLVVVATRWRSRQSLLLVVGVSYPLLFALSPYSWYLDDPRYLLLLSPVVALLAAQAVQRWVLAGVAVLAAGLALSIVGIAAIPAQLPYPQDFQPLIHRLEAMGTRRAFADYWVAYRVDFESKERLTLSPTSPIRYVPFDAEVRRDPDPAYIFLKGTLPEAQFLSQLQGLGVTATVSTVGGFRVYVPSQKVVPPRPGQPPGPVQRPGR